MEEEKLNRDGEEFVEDDAFVGQVYSRPLPSFQVVLDLFEGYFVFL